MNRENVATHITDQIGDYVLGLLPSGDEQRLKQHIAYCDECRLYVQRDRAMVQAVREALTASSKPEPLRLRQLMPAVPGVAGSKVGNMGWQGQFAAALLLLLVILAGWSIEMARRPVLWPGSQSGIYATAAIVDTPTLTATSTSVSVYATETAIPTPIASHALPAPLPAVAPIPIAPSLH